MFLITFNLHCINGKNGWGCDVILFPIKALGTTNMPGKKDRKRDRDTSRGAGGGLGGLGMFGMPEMPSKYQ